MLKPALLSLLFSAANAYWHVLDSAQSPQNSLSVVHLRLLTKSLLFLCSADDSIHQHSVSNRQQCFLFVCSSGAIRTCQCLWVGDSGDVSCDSWRVTVTCWCLLIHGRHQLGFCCCIAAVCCRCVGYHNWIHVIVVSLSLFCSFSLTL